jgi:hypothetical protein
VRVGELAVVEHDVRVRVRRHRKRPLSDAGADQRPPLALTVPQADEAQDFALAGGAALIVRGDVRRTTRDLDFFGLSADAVDMFLLAGNAGSNQTGASLVRGRSPPARA